MTKEADQFNWAAQEAASRGFSAVNLNLGCPSATVTAKGKGSALLSDLPFLKAFLDGIFADPPLPISIKTRIGFENNSIENWKRIFDLLSKYPLQELIIHPRLRSDFYTGPLHMAAFRYAYENAFCPLVYNGDITDAAGFQALQAEFPALSGVMVGRGLMKDPALIRELQATDRESMRMRNGTGARAVKTADVHEPGDTTLKPAELQAFLQDLYGAYRDTYGSVPNALKKMKGIWAYIGEDAPERGKDLKPIMKAKTESAYSAAVSAWFAGKLN